MDRPARRRIWVLGLAGLGKNVGWGMNKVFTAALLGARGAGAPLVGAVLGIEGFFGIILNPLTGFISDRMETRFGRRRPYLFIGFPGAAVALLLIYFAHALGLAIAATVAFYFFQQISQTPYQAMMPDNCEESEYGEASGILNLLWTLGNLVAFLVVPLVWEYGGHLAAFLLGAVVLLATGLITAVRSREKPAPASPRPRPDLGPLANGELWKYYIAQALWWLGFEAIASFFTLYTVHALHGSLLDSALGMSIFTVTGVAVSLWFGRLYERRDARLLLGASIGLFALVALSGLMVQTVTQAFVLLAFAGVAWGGIQVVSYPLAVDTLREDLVRRGMTAEAASATTAELHGAIYGGVNLVQALGLTIAAPLAGQAIAATGEHYSTMFVVSAASLAVSLGIVASMRPVGRPIAAVVDGPRAY